MAKSFVGNQGLRKSAEAVPNALSQCIKAVKRLAHPQRMQVLRGLSTWIIESEVPIEIHDGKFD